MSKFWNARVANLTPYIPGEQPQGDDLVKLNTNELPYSPSQRAIDAMRAVCSASLRLYPDPESCSLRAAIARLAKCALSNIFVGNGSDEVLGHAFNALIRDDGPLLFADVAYGFYPVYCHLYGLKYQEIPLREDFSIAVDDYITPPATAIVIANPNANTGIALKRAEIERLLIARPDCTVIIDEAYVDFGAESSSCLINKYPNLLVVQTLSKSRGLAGLRVGFALGHPELIAGLVRVKDSFNSYPLSRVAQAGAQAAIEDTIWLAETTHTLQEERDHLICALREMDFDVLPSSANFIAAHHPRCDGKTLCAELRKRSILVRHLSHRRIRDWTRITIGTPDQHAKLIDAIKEILRTL